MWLMIAMIFIGNTAFIFGQAQQDNGNEVRVGRISLLRDSVLMKRGDDDQWYDAALNTPIQTGDRIYTGDDGRTELQLDGNLYRLNSRSGFDLLDLSDARSQFSLYAGTLTVDLRYPPLQPVEIDVPEGSVTLSKPGLYRIDAYESGGMKMIVWQGEAEVYNGTSIPVYPDQQIVVKENNYDITVADSPDDWDIWNTDRNQELAKAEQSRRYVTESQNMVGVEDLDSDGRWSNVPGYGWAWTPTTVEAGWAPYREGRWVWRDPYGWTWVSRERWGWAPYHYGRWVVVEDRWYWVPGSNRRYSPALVGFVSSNGGLYIGWVPLAPRDQFVPWWGPRRSSSAVTIAYYNQSFGASITITTAGGFANGEVHHNEIIAREGFRLSDSRPMTVIKVVPTRKSLAPSQARTIVMDRNATRYFDRQVVLKNRNIPVVRPFSEKVVEIKEHHGVPVSDFKRDSKGAPVFQDRSLGNNGRAPAGEARENHPPALVKQPGLGNSIGTRTNDGSSRSGGNTREPERTVKPLGQQQPPSSRPQDLQKQASGQDQRKISVQQQRQVARPVPQQQRVVSKQHPSPPLQQQKSPVRPHQVSPPTQQIKKLPPMKQQPKVRKPVPKNKIPPKQDEKKEQPHE
jgi:hypothetical protein